MYCTLRRRLLRSFFLLSQTQRNKSYQISHAHMNKEASNACNDGSLQLKMGYYKQLLQAEVHDYQYIKHVH